MKNLQYLAAILLMVFGMSAFSMEEKMLLNDQPIPFKEDKTLSDKTLLKVGVVSVFGVFAVLVIVVALKKFVSRTQFGLNGSDRIHVESIKRVSAKLMILIIRVDSKEYLLTHSGDQVAIVEHLDSACNDKN